MTSYINIISDSSERLFDGSEEYIDLPPEMKELEVKLNHFRSESIKNKKSAEENEKKKDLQKIESNKIGLKSVQKIVETHHGQLFIQDLPETFVLIITLPYN